MDEKLIKQEPNGSDGSAVKNTIRGFVGNALAVGLLYGLSFATATRSFAALSLGIQWAVYLVHGLPFSSEKFYDASGSLTYLLLIIFALTRQREHGPRQIVNAVLVVVWLSRLGSFLFARILKDGRDERFTALKQNPLRFLAAWSIQALWVFLVVLPVLLVVQSPRGGSSVGPLDVVGWAVWTAGFLIEVIADAQKNSFRDKPENKGKFIAEGLWAYSRHPNYFGEITLWVGLCISGSSCFQGAEWLGWLSLVFTVFLLTKVSGVPMLEKKAEKEWGQLEEYQHYVKHTPCIRLAFSRPPAYQTA
mmetsp:Transcript_126041/g.368301  ORF Transcript_126041/g.368301 Transcript_126041/m.368301 type:complete len:305 (-) Transcript_126041:176-1090(-)